MVRGQTIGLSSHFFTELVQELSPPSCSSLVTQLSGDYLMVIFCSWRKRRRHLLIDWKNLEKYTSSLQR